MPVVYRPMRPDEEAAALTLWMDVLETDADEALGTSSLAPPSTRLMIPSFTAITRSCPPTDGHRWVQYGRFSIYRTWITLLAA
jgi:hypothetical protein